MTSLASRCVRFAALGLALTLPAACGDPAGAPCTIEGSGFTARDPCANKCLERWTITCPGNRDVHASLCSGRETCEPGSCPEGQACYSFNDPFDVVSYCVPLEACFQDSIPRNEIFAWEAGSFERSAATREHFDKKKRHRSGAPTDP